MEFLKFLPLSRVFFKIQIKRKLLVISCLKDDYVEIKHNYASSVNHSVILFFFFLKLEIMYKIVTLQNDTTIYIIITVYN